MNKKPILLISISLIIAIHSLNAQRKPLAINDIESWNRITEKEISPDGKWIAYKMEPWVGDSKIFLYNSQGVRMFETACSKEITFTEDSKYLLFTMTPAYDLVRKIKLNRDDNKGIPPAKLGIYSLKTGSLDTIHDIRNFKIPEHWTGYVAYQVEKSSADYDCLAAQNKTENAASTDNGYGLYLRRLDSGKTVSWPFVSEYLFSKTQEKLCFASTGDEANFAAGVYLYDCETGHAGTIIQGEYDYRLLTFSGDSKMLSFLAKPSNRIRQGEFSLYLWPGEGTASEVANNNMKEIPFSWRISENRSISFSGNGQRIFFGIAPVRPARDPNIPDDEYPVLDVWHGAEGLLHTVQLVNKEKELKRTYLTMYDVLNGALLRIENEDIPESYPIDNSNADHYAVYTGQPYELQSMYDPMHHDIYLLNLQTGTRQPVKVNIRSVPKSSPAGKYLIWFNHDNYSWYTYHIGSGREFRITDPGVLRAEIETNTTFDVNEPYGSPGWLEDDRAVLIYDRYDIWKVDPQNLTPPVNITQNGRNTSTVYRLINFDQHQESFSENVPQLLTGINENTRVSGYYKWMFKKPSQPEMLIGGDYNLSAPLKAEKANTVVYTRETFEVFPDLIVSDLSFRHNLRISDANPQQQDYRWGTAEIYQWTSLDGREMEGMLFKPEDFDPSKKYPMIVTFFHKSSAELHNHRIPEYHRSRIDYHTFTSNGYLIFNPDIWFDPGYIGESAYKSVMPGVTALIGEGFVDPALIGAGGHSYSGYQLAYIATRTDLFACIEAGAPVVNFFSAYGGIRWETGRSRAAQYEHDQTLAPLWEAPLRFLENSPIFAMDKVKTPILIMHNDADGAVPWYQGIEYFIALRRMNKPVWLLNYNGEPHSLTQLKNQKDFQIRLMQFFDHYLKDAPMPDWMKSGIPAVEKDYNLGYELNN